MSKRNEWDKIALGIAIIVGVNGLAFCFGFIIVAVILGNPYSTQNTQRMVLGNIIEYAIAGFGMSQLLYVVPLCIWLKRKNRVSMMKGVIIGAVITALVNGACYLPVIFAYF